MTESLTPEEHDAIDADEAEALVRKMIENAEVIMEDTFTIAGVTFTIESVNFEETLDALRSVSRDDPHSKDLSLQKEMLKRSISRINGRKVSKPGLETFIDKASPGLIRQIHEHFLAIRNDHAVKWSDAVELIKK